MLLGFDKPAARTAKRAFPSATFFGRHEVELVERASAARAMSRRRFALERLGEIQLVGKVGSLIPAGAVKANQVRRLAAAALELSNQHRSPEILTPYLHLEPKLAQVALDCILLYAETPAEFDTEYQLLAQAIAEQVEQQSEGPL